MKHTYKKPQIHWVPSILSQEILALGVLVNCYSKSTDTEFLFKEICQNSLLKLKCLT